METKRNVLIGIAMFITLASIVLQCYSIVGFSTEKTAILFAHWLYTDLGTTKYGDIKFHNYIEYGLRKFVYYSCEDDLCTYEEFSWGDCDDDSDKSCSSCLKSGNTTGVFIIVSLCLAVTALYFNAIRLSESIDGWALKLTTMLLHTAIMVFQLIALFTFGLGCYQKLNDMDYFDVDDGKQYLGPAFAAAISVCIIQCLIIIFHFFVPAVTDATPLQQREETGDGRNSFGMELERL